MRRGTYPRQPFPFLTFRVRWERRVAIRFRRCWNENDVTGNGDGGEFPSSQTSDHLSLCDVTASITAAILPLCSSLRCLERTGTEGSACHNYPLHPSRPPRPPPPPPLPTSACVATSFSQVLTERCLGVLSWGPDGRRQGKWGKIAGQWRHGAMAGGGDWEGWEQGGAW